MMSLTCHRFLGCSRPVDCRFTISYQSTSPSYGGVSSEIAVSKLNGVKILLKFVRGSSARELRGLGRRVSEVSRRLEVIITRISRLPGIASLEDKVKAAARLGVAPPIGECHSPDSYCLVYPYVEGSIVEMAPSQPTLDVGGARELFCRILGVSKLIEDAGVLHGDIHPHNIILSSEGPVITDFDGSVPFDDSGGRKSFPMGGPAFVFDIESAGPVAYRPRVDRDLYYDYIDYFSVIFVGLILAASTGEGFQVIRSKCCPKVEGEVKEKLVSIMGSAFTRHLTSTIEGSPEAPPNRPLAKLLDDMRGEGVCQ